MAAVLSISGHVGRSRFRAKIDAGFEAPAKLRLDLPAPGKSIFQFVATGNDATLVFPRDERVLRHTPPAATLEALAGVPLGPEELRSIVAGCGFGSAQPTAGKSFGESWAAVDVAGATNWLQQTEGRWRLAAASRGPVEVRYSDFASGRPATIRLRTSGEKKVDREVASDVETDLTIRLSQVDVNQTIAPEAFEVEIPAGATPMTLDELRQAGPLGRKEEE
jgi:hypothetical protein